MCLRAFSHIVIALAISCLSVFLTADVRAQGGQTLFGDVKIDETGVQSPAPKVTLVLYRDVGGEVGRQGVSNGSQYRFTNLRTGDYELAIEVDNNEIGRVRVMIQGLSNDPHGFRQDLSFALKPRNSSRPHEGVISAADLYNRPAANQSRFEKAQSVVGKKRYDEAASLLKEIVDNDKLDFQAWTLLGSVCVLEDKTDDAEKAYLSALDAKPTFVLALIDLGKLRSNQKRFEEAIDPLTRAVEAQPQSGEANLLLGEAYLHLKKGSKAVPYLNQAANFGHPEAHLRLGWLYNAAGLKDRAVLEYEEFLKKKPDYEDRKKLEAYIKANKKDSAP